MVSNPVKSLSSTVASEHVDREVLRVIQICTTRNAIVNGPDQRLPFKYLKRLALN
jgi:hypothetical protein